MTATAAQIDTATVRATEFPMNEIWAYLNHASVGPLPLGICAAGIDWRDGDEVVIPHSEYPSLAIPFLAQAGRGVHVRWAAKTDDQRTDLNAIEAAITRRTRAVAISDVEYADGFRNDPAVLGSLCRDRGLPLIVDATQSLGAVPLDVDGLGDSRGRRARLQVAARGLRDWRRRILRRGVGAHPADTWRQRFRLWEPVRTRATGHLAPD